MKTRAVVLATVSLTVLAISWASALAQRESAPIKGERAWERSHWTWGFGGVVNHLPLPVSTFNVPLQYVSYEHTFGENPAAPVKVSVSPGLYGFFGFLPIPALESSVIYDSGPVGGRLAVGGFYDLLVGGHWGMTTKLGTIIKRKYELGIIFVPVGEEHPEVLYEEIWDIGHLRENKSHKDPVTGEEIWDQTIEFPYYGLLLSIYF